MSEHTPGPWNFDEHGGTFYVWGPRQSMVADGYTDEGYITRMRGVGRGATVEEQRANARLIAAAPDLYEALSYITGAIEASGGWDGDDEAFAKGMAALRKAEAPRG